MDISQLVVFDIIKHNSAKGLIISNNYVDAFYISCPITNAIIKIDKFEFPSKRIIPITYNETNTIYKIIFISDDIALNLAKLDTHIAFTFEGAIDNAVVFYSLN
jgi:hypothetical protein